MYCRYARGSGDRTFCDQPDREKSNDHQLQIEDCKPVCIMGAGTERKRSGGQRKRSAAWYYRIKHVGVHIFAIKLLQATNKNMEKRTGYGENNELTIQLDAKLCNYIAGVK